MGGVTIAVPPMHLNQPQQGPGPLEQYAQLLGIKNQQQEQQLRAGQVQLQQQQIKDQEAMRTAVSQWDGKDPNELVNYAIKNGASANAVIGIKQHILTQQKTYSDIAKQDADTGATNLATLQKKNDQAAGALNNVKTSADLASTAQQLFKDGIIDQQHAQAFTQLSQLPDDQMLAQLGNMKKGMLSNSQQMENALKDSEVKKNNAEGAAAGGVEMKTMNDFLAHPPPGYSPTPMSYQKYKQDQSRESEVAKETDPHVLRSKMNLQASEAQIQQTIKNGSAKDAGTMLAGGLVAPSEIAARSNPSFLVQANRAALDIDPKYNMQKAEADFSIAKSPENTRFFGSANSLINKGGTLDQLEAAGKNIPQHDLQALNTLADWQKAASGSGPIAKYASVALGVADDYAKVMGGGAGSDTSREQALKLIGANLSPEQRAQSIEGIRGAVGSQTESRTGNNRVLKNMYGQQPAQSGAAASVTAPTATGPNGHKIVVKDGKWVDAQTGVPIQ